MRSKILPLTMCLAGAAALMVLGCSDDKKMSWSEESKGYQKARQERIDTLMGQGMALTSAARAVDFEAAVRNTERGSGVPPLEGAELDAALRQPLK